MSEWEVFGVIAGLVAFSASIIAPVVKLNTSITRLTVALDSIAERQRAFEGHNERGHKRLWDKLEQNGGTLLNHEKRISCVEQTRKEKSNGGRN